MSSRFRDGRLLHEALHNIPADVPPHVLPDAGREPIVEAGINARQGDLVRVRPNVGPAMRDAGRSRAGHADFRNVRTAQHALYDGRDGSAADAVGTWVLRMHRRIVDRLPGRIELGRRILVDVAVADRGDRTPEVVVVRSE